jgi:ribokinase
VNAEKPTIISIGDIVADILTTISFPVEAGSVLMSRPPLVEPGGACNFAIAGARLGSQIVMIGAPGADTFGRLVIDILNAEGVDTHLVTLQPDVPTTLVIVLADVEKFTQTYISAPVLSSGAYPFTTAVQGSIDQAGALYVQGYTLCEDYLWEVTRASMEYATGKLPIYFDPSPLFKTALPERQSMALALSDVVLCTEDELELIRPSAEDTNPDLLSAVANHLFGLRVQALIVKRGAKGCRVVTRSGREDVAGFPVHAVGAAAAGDAFNAGFISARLRDYSLKDAAIIANAVGAVKVTRLGGGQQVPHRHEVQALLDQHQINLSLARWSTPPHNA